MGWEGQFSFFLPSLGCRFYFKLTLTPTSKKASQTTLLWLPRAQTCPPHLCYGLPCGLILPIPQGQVLVDTHSRPVAGLAQCEGGGERRGEWSTCGKEHGGGAGDAA